MSKVLIARQAIELFLEYREVHGHDEDSAFAQTLREFGEAELVEALENTDIVKGIFKSYRAYLIQGFSEQQAEEMTLLEYKGKV